MGYRFDDRPPKPEDHLIRFAVRNGATMKAKFRCYYIKKGKPHNPLFHDHVGWPQPTRPDGSCQMMVVREDGRCGLPTRRFMYSGLEEIHLDDEGYTEAFVTFEDDEYSAFLTDKAWIDKEYDNVVRVQIGTALPSFSDKPIDIRFTVFVQKENIIDAVAHGVLSVLPGRAKPATAQESNASPLQNEDDSPEGSEYIDG